MRYTHTPLGSGLNQQSTIDQNFEDIEAAIADTLSRVDESPNMMQTTLDMNSNKIINLPSASSSSEPLTYGQWLAAGSPATYYGAFKWAVTATAGQASFTGITPAYSPGIGNISVYVNGVYQGPSAYTETSTTSVTLTAGVEVGDEVVFVINQAITTGSIPSTTAALTSVVISGASTTVELELNKDQTAVSVAAMKALTTPTDGSRCTTLGYYAAGDLGDGAYRYNLASTATQDNGSVITPNSGTGRWLLIAKGVDVRQFGAKGDGVTDDTVAIQTATNYAATTKTGKVYLPFGVYVVSTLYLYYDAALNPGFPATAQAQGRIALVGDGSIEKAGFVNSVYSGTLLKSSSVTTPAIRAEATPTGLRAIRLKDLSVQQSNNDFIISFDGANTKVYIDDVSIYQGDNSGSAVNLSNTYLAQVNLLYIWHANELGTGTGFRCRNTTVSAGQVLLSNCSVVGWLGVGGVGYEIGHRTNGSGTNINTVNLSSCQASTCEYGMLVGHGCNNVNLYSPHYEANTKADVKVYNNAIGVVVDGGYFASISPLYGGIMLGDATLASTAREWKAVAVRGCSFTGYTTYCVNVDFIGSSSGALDVSANYFNGTAACVAIQLPSGASKHGVNIGANLYAGSITQPNQVVNYKNSEFVSLDGQNYSGRTMEYEQIAVASATSITYVTTGNIWRITGTTTIDSITAPVVGSPVIYLLFESTPTVRDTSIGAGNIHLVGNASFVATADDVMCLMWDANGTRWIQVSPASVN